MSKDDERQVPSLTIVGGQPKANRHIPGGEEADVPAGLQMLLYQAARDGELKRRLLADRAEALDQSGIALEDSERATLQAVSDDALVAMIDRIVPSNPRSRSVMTKVAAAVASLAAGTAAGTITVACDESSLDGGAGPNTWVDGGTGGTSSSSTTGGSGGEGVGGMGGSVGGAGGSAGGTGGAGGAGGG